MIYDLYMAQGGGGIAMQESTLLFAQVIASRASGHPLEAIMMLKAKDSVYLKNRVYRFSFCRNRLCRRYSGSQPGICGSRKIHKVRAAVFL